MRMHDEFGLNWSLLEQLTLNAIDGAFLNDPAKEKLRERVRAAASTVSQA